jgi:hypothetical protein
MRTLKILIVNIIIGCMLGAGLGVVLGIAIVVVPGLMLCWVSPEFNKGGSDLLMLVFFTVPGGCLLGALIGAIVAACSPSLAQREPAAGEASATPSDPGDSADRGRIR